MYRGENGALCTCSNICANRVRVVRFVFIGCDRLAVERNRARERVQWIIVTVVIGLLSFGYDVFKIVKTTAGDILTSFKRDDNDTSPLPSPAEVNDSQSKRKKYNDGPHERQHHISVAFFTPARSHDILFGTQLAKRTRMALCTCSMRFKEEEGTEFNQLSPR